MQHVTPKEAAKILGVHVSSLRRWENEGKLRAIRTPGGQRRFILEEVEKIGGIPRTIKTICYGRVSTHSQQDDLQRQLEHLRTRYPEAEIISEVGSGLNFKRKKFLAILERIIDGDIQRIVVAHPDRLVRFGFELVRWLCTKFECELVVLNDRKLSPEQELVQDMLSIIHCFSSRLYGLRKYKSSIKEDLQKEVASQGIDKAVTEQCIENQAIS
ncbi:IS607 family transposase [Anabaenopsis elenkinii CCIBt3563]|uniref:IS607 family transposase n=1 Tax=Anabaenopsis elenkinii CCIBt3563 TaxID=2779889 RepID=A0A7S6U4P6_9CYAN|nr:IS607 family transposase [Anabaenopsis elenkinii]QOV23386.1 IS607 family transposase [Anabaenopsis elenkinii CCIBt3563]QOV23390.1 IS607 family transposase [Anabaenopsis elenkinii CCIBt3563]